MTSPRSDPINYYCRTLWFSLLTLHHAVSGASEPAPASAVSVRSAAMQEDISPLIGRAFRPPAEPPLIESVTGHHSTLMTRGFLLSTISLTLVVLFPMFFSDGDGRNLTVASR